LKLAFGKLRGLEEFVSIRDDLHLPDYEYGVEEARGYGRPPPIHPDHLTTWPDWKTLRRLALCNLYVDASVRQFLANLQRLEVLVLNGPSFEQFHGLGEHHARVMFMIHRTSSLKTIQITRNATFRYQLGRLSDISSVHRIMFFIQARHRPLTNEEHDSALW
jgi:hypothetical protein